MEVESDYNVPFCSLAEAKSAAHKVKEVTDNAAHKAKEVADSAADKMKAGTAPKTEEKK
jgi:hypothetical protein